MEKSARIEEYVEGILLKADKRVLSALAPLYRCVILVLRSLMQGPMSIRDIEALIEGSGIKCRSLNRAIDMLMYYDFVKCSGVGDEKKCELSSLGLEMATALYEFVESLRSFVYNVLDGTVTDSDIAANLVTGIASTVGFVESYVEEPSLVPLYVAIHMYISGLSAMLLALLSRVDARVLSVVRDFGFQETSS